MATIIIFPPPPPSPLDPRMLRDRLPFCALNVFLEREVETELKLDFGDGFSGKKQNRSDSWEAVEEEEGEVGAQFFFIFTSLVFGRRKARSSRLL